MLKVIDSGKLNWIEDCDLLFDHQNVPTDIRGVIPFIKNEEENLLFINHQIYKNFSPIFSYCMRSENKIKDHNKKKEGPYYHQCFQKDAKYVVGSKIQNFIILGREQNGTIELDLCDVYSNKNGKLKFRILKQNNNVDVDENNNNCFCQKYKQTKKKIVCTRKMVKKKCMITDYENNNKFSQYLYLDNVYHHIVELVNEKLHNNEKIELKGITVIEDFRYLLFGFQYGNSLVLVKSSYYIDGNYIILTDGKVMKYSYNYSWYKNNSVSGCIELSDIVFDQQNKKLLILTKTNNGGQLWELKWYNNFKSFNYVIKPAFGKSESEVKFTEKQPKKMAIIDEGKIFVVYEEYCGNKINYEILKPN